MPECPDCKSTSVQSKGYRTKGVHRYVCNQCGRNFQIDKRTEEEKYKARKQELPSKLKEEVESIEAEAKGENTMNKAEELERDVKDGKYDGANINKVEYHPMKMINVTIPIDLKEWLESLKLVKQEPLHNVLRRIKDSEHWEGGL